MRATYQVADVLNRNINQLEALQLNSWQLRTLYAIAACRTQAMGWHMDQCTNPQCQHVHISYNSCRNRHCPKCQGIKREQWIRAREAELIKAPYYHVVFTLPPELNRYCLFKPELIYGLLFKTAWSVINDFAANRKFLGAKTGMIAVLHTWGQNLSLHPHLHCIVPGGGVTAANKWKQARGKGKYLFPVKAMGKVFRARFMANLRSELELEQQIAKRLFDRNWVVYCKIPFFGPAQVIEYLGRYTHKIAISNHRIKSIKNNQVTFSAKDYRNGGRKTIVSLCDREFIRRFSLHILPKGFTRIRHYGILSSTLKKQLLPMLKLVVGEFAHQTKKQEYSRICNECHKGLLLTIRVYRNRGPPVIINNMHLP